MGNIKVAKFLSSQGNTYISTKLRLSMHVLYVYRSKLVIWHCTVIPLFLKTLHYSSYRNSISSIYFEVKTNLAFKTYSNVFKDEIINWNIEKGLIQKCFIPSNTLSFFFFKKAGWELSHANFVAWLPHAWLQLVESS